MGKFNRLGKVVARKTATALGNKVLEDRKKALKEERESREALRKAGWKV